MPKLVTRQYVTPKRQPTKNRDHPESPPSTPHLYRTVFIANLGGILVGMHLVLFSGILEMPHFVRTLGSRPPGQMFGTLIITPVTKSVITSSLIVSLTIASPLVGVLIDQIGRRASLLLMSALFVLSSAAMLNANTVQHLIVTRVIAGIAYAIATIAIPLYTAEVAPPKRRGALVNLYQITIAIGILLAQLCNIRYSNSVWTAPVFLTLAPAVGTFFAVLAGMSESPVWLSTKQASKIALPVSVSGAEAPDRAGRTSRAPSTLRSILKEASSRRRLIIGTGLSVAQQWCGINAVFFYAPAIINDVLQWKGTAASLHAAAAVGFVNLVATLLAVLVINITGRRALLLAGAPAMGISLLIIGAMRDEILPKQPILGVGALLVYVAAYGLTYGPVPLVVASEIFPPRCSGICMSICIGVLGFCSATVGLAFLPLLQWMGGAIFFLFALFLVFSTTFVWYQVPETKDLTLQQIDQLFDGDSSSR